MFMLAAPITKSLFFEDVQAWLDLAAIRYLPRVRLSGASGFDHTFDFAIPGSRQAPERLIRTIANPTRDKAENFAFAWIDTAEARRQQQEPLGYAIINDSDRTIPVTVTEALRAYQITPVTWSQRSAHLEQLAA